MLTGFSTMMGLELELLAWVSALGSLCNLPSDLDQILPFLSTSLSLSLEQAFVGQLKLGHHLHQPTKQNKHTQHAMQS